jgi:hypothetical protein
MAESTPVQQKSPTVPTQMVDTVSRVRGVPDAAPTVPQTVKEKFEAIVTRLHGSVCRSNESMPDARAQLVAWYRGLTKEEQVEIAGQGRLYLRRAIQISEALHQEFFELTHQDV